MGIPLIAGLVLIGFTALISGEAVVSGEAVADSGSVSKKRTFGLRGEGRGHIQLRAIIAPVLKNAKSKHTDSATVTVVLTVKDNLKIGKVCKKGPKITDALLRTWSRNPILRRYLYDRSRHNGETQMDYRRTKMQRKIDNKLLKLINRTLKMDKDEVTGILVVKGIYRSGGGSIMKLPFSSVNGCDEFKEGKEAR